MTPKRRPQSRQIAGKAKAASRPELRSLELLEHLNQVGRECKVTEIVRALDMPQSSTSRLLSQLSDAGYLFYDRRKRTYRPSARTALLSAQTMTRMFADRQLLRMIEDLGPVSETPVLLVSRNEAQLNILHAGGKPVPANSCYPVGHVGSLMGSASGQMVLSRYQDSQILKLVQRYNIQTGNPTLRIKSEVYMERIGEARRAGYLVQPVEAALRSIGRSCRGAGSPACAVDCCLARRGAHIVAPVPSEEGQDIVAIVGMPAHLEPAYFPEFACDVKSIIQRHMGSMEGSARVV